MICLNSSKDLKLKIASYNIHSCIGKNKKYRPDQIVSVIKEMDPDIIGLQEVDTGYRVHKFKDKMHQLEEISSITKLNYIEGPTMKNYNGFFGNAILTKHSILEVRYVDLSMNGYEPRGLIDADIDYNGNKIRFIVTHLGLKFKERKWQVKKILEVLEKNKASTTILYGDFNEWFFTSPAIKLIESKYGKPKFFRTFPSFFPIFPLDKIWIIKEKGQIKNFLVHKTKLSKIASDHLPIQIAIDI